MTVYVVIMRDHTGDRRVHSVWCSQKTALLVANKRDRAVVEDHDIADFDTLIEGDLG